MEKILEGGGEEIFFNGCHLKENLKRRPCATDGIYSHSEQFKKTSQEK